MRTVAVVLAAGSGLRFGAALPKQLLPLAGRALLEHSVAAFEQAPGVDATLVVMAPGHAAHVRELLAAGGYRKLTGIIEGGLTRPELTRRAIDALGPAECNVLFHDAARPLLDQATIAACVGALDTLRGRRGGGAHLRHDRGRRGRPDDRDAAPRHAAPLPDPAGLPAVGDPQGPRAGPGRPGLRGPHRHRRLRGGAALPAGRAGRGGARQRAQHQDHLSGGSEHRRSPAERRPDEETADVSDGGR